MRDSPSVTIYAFRGRQVMLDGDVAALFGVRTGALNQAVERNAARFGEDACFYLDPDEWEALKSQTVTSKGRGGRRKPPRMFTERGVYLVSTVLRSPRANDVVQLVVDVFIRAQRVGPHDPGRNLPDPVVIETELLPAVAERGLFATIRAMVGRVADALGDPEVQELILEEALDLLALAVGSLKARLRAPALEAERTAAEAAKLAAEAEKLRLEAERLRDGAPGRRLGLVKEALEKAGEAERRIAGEDLRQVLGAARRLRDDEGEA